MLGLALLTVAAALPAAAEPGDGNGSTRPAPVVRAAVAPHERPSAQQILERYPAPVIAKLQAKRQVILPSDGGDEGWVGALVLFSQPEERVRRLLLQTERQKEFRPDLREVRTLHRFEGGCVDENSMKVMFVTVRYRLRYSFDFADDRIEWVLDPEADNDLQRLEGFWALHPLDEKTTLAEFGTVVNVGPAVPGFLQDYATRKSVPETVDHVRHWVDSGGTWRP